MVVYNYSGAEINAKVVYYGPALSGKTTNLEYLYANMPAQVKGKMVSMKTRTDRTLFFDFLPVEVGEINGFRTRILLYTVPGQVYYNATRKLVLKGVDAIVFVADSSAAKMEENLESLRNLEENLNEHGLTLDTIPWIIQYNKRDVGDAAPIKTLASKLNLMNVPSYKAVAAKGDGVYETFEGISKRMYSELTQRLKEGPPAEKPARVKKKGQTATVPDSPPLRGRHDDPPITDVVEVALREVGDQDGFHSHDSAFGSPEADQSRPLPSPDLELADPEASDEADFKFAPLEPDTIDDTVGRVVQLEETSPSQEPSPSGEFIVDPFHSRTKRKTPEKPTKKASPATAPPKPKAPATVSPKPKAPVTASPKPKAAPAGRPAPARAAAPVRRVPESTAAHEVTVKVPVVISRSEAQKAVPIKLLLEIEIVDDES